MKSGCSIFQKTAFLLLAALCVLAPGNFNTKPAHAGGSYLRDLVSLDRDYEWYMDQYSSGEVSELNCGPSCAVMAEMWADGYIALDIGETRQDNYKNASVWTLRDIYNNLDSVAVESQLLRGAGVEAFVRHLNAGRLVIVGYNTGSVAYTPQSGNMTGRFYPENTWHFIILKGYRVMDREIYFQVYDPANKGRTYKNGSPMGKNRLYKATELNNSCYDDYIVVYAADDD